MYKLIVLSAVIAVASGVAVPIVPRLVGGPVILNSPAGAVNNVLANQILSGVTANQAALNSVALSNPLAVNAILANNAGLGLGLGLGGLGLGNLGLAGLGGRVIVG